MIKARSFLPHTVPRLSLSARAAFTLVELLVVIAIIGVLVGLLVPAVQVAREAARRASCTNNLHQIAIGVLNYESQHKMYPPGNINWPVRSGGAKISPSGNNSLQNAVPGHSWFLRILGHMEEVTLQGRLTFAPPKYGLPHYVSHHSNYFVVRNHVFSWATCPSSPMPSVFIDKSGIPGETVPSEGRYQICDYVGISGSILRKETNPVNHSPMFKAFSGIIVDTRCGIFVDPRHDLCVRDPVWVTTGSVTDGTSNTLMLGEQSDYCKTPDGEDRDCRSNRMAHEGNKGNAHVNSGTALMTTVLHPINTKDATAINAQTMASSSPIQSAHPLGAVMARGDGSVFFMPDSVDLQVLYNLCDKNDGLKVDMP